MPFLGIGAALTSAAGLVSTLRVRLVAQTSPDVQMQALACAVPSGMLGTVISGKTRRPDACYTNRRKA